jgi:hypothetical protein
MGWIELWRLLGAAIIVLALGYAAFWITTALLR